MNYILYSLIMPIALLTTTPSAASIYSFQSLNLPDSARVEDISNNNIVIGNNNGKGFIYDYSGASFYSEYSANFYGTNNSGIVAGNYKTSFNNNVSYYGSLYPSLDSHYFNFGQIYNCCNSNQIEDINDLNQVVGVAFDLYNNAIPFLATNGIASTLGFSGVATGINNSGNIVGYQSNGIGVMIKNGALSQILIPGAYQVIPTGINNHNVIAGYYISPDGILGFVLEDNNFTSISFPNSTSTFLFGINDFGVITGLAGGNTSFIATPISTPIPSTFFIFLSGILSIVGILNRKNS